ncbi:MAG TPA: CgeB family protein [Candidatus Brocadiia bacterium]|nr:glycosyltransferase [Candidatus Brocadiales bacterium]
MEVLKEAKMDVKDNIKGVLRKAPRIYRLCACWAQTRLIEKEQLYYEQKAVELGLSRDFSIKEIKQQLKEKLSKRNIFIKPKLKEDLHIVYALPDESYWNTLHIVPALKEFATVTTYCYSEYGFNDNMHGWLPVRDKMNSHFMDFIKQLHKKKHIDLILTYFAGKHVYCSTVESLNNMGIVTAASHYDDRLYFRGRLEGGCWSGPVDVCKFYDLNLTQAPESLIKYRVEGGIAMLWPLAANQGFFYPRGTPFHYDVSFVGTAKASRRHFIEYLFKKGIKVETFGAGWHNGTISNEKVPEIFSSSKINLNFGNIGHTPHQCGKCRDFEIPMSGGLMLTTHNEHLADCFELNKDIFTFRNKEECLEQIHRLLADEALCERARKNARERALKEHTWEQRIKSLLQVMGYIQQE